MSSFSERYGDEIEPAKIVIRLAAPMELRLWLFSLVKRLDFSISSFREIVCQKSFQTANPDQWSENSYMEEEVRGLLEKCRWNYIYDIIEEVAGRIKGNAKDEFVSSINKFFINNGYGWKLENGLIHARGDAAFEQSIETAVKCIKSSNNDAYNEIKEALSDISRRPEPDVTGAIQHSLAALECFCRNIFHDEKSTLGDLINHRRKYITPPIDIVMEKLWGFASERGRHIREGRVPEYEEAEFVVHVCASLIPYLNTMAKHEI